jgi:Phosphopantetheine attachment site
MFSTMPYSSGIRSQAERVKTSEKIEQLIAEAEAEDLEGISSIISSGITKEAAALMALEQKEISLEIPIAELGLDSLIAFELKNWISGSLEAAMQTSEILDMPSITLLANKVLERSALVAHHV